MTAVATEHHGRFWEGAYADDGYDFMANGEAAGWRSVSAWGRDGWDLGDWPYVVVLFRDRVISGDGAHVDYQRAIYCEGDVTVETYASDAARERATDETALFYWKANGATWLDRGDDLRGPYSRARAAS